MLALCLFASGSAGLIYEVVWVRLFSEVMGHTVYALSAVLTSFLGGLALGAYLAGRWTQRRGATLRLYAGIEVGIAGFAVAMPWLIDACTPVFGMAYRSFGDSFVTYNMVQFLVCGSILLIPTVLMGATLPVVTTLLLSGEEDITAGAGQLYGLNTIGAAVGAAGAGFFLLPVVGMAGTALLAACVNVLVAVVAVCFGSQPTPVAASQPVPREREARARPTDRRETRSRRRPPSPSTPHDWQAPSHRTLLWLYGLSGFASLALEVAWARVVSLSIGSTTYGFTVILVTFITGLALGSFVGGRAGVLRRRPVMTVCLLNVAVAMWSLLSLPYLGSLPIRVIQLMGKLGLDFTHLLAGEIALVASTILFPTLCMGAMFPLVAQLVYRAVGESGRAVGAGYAANTWGNIVGSFMAGFVLIPVIGMRATIVVSAAISAGVAGAYVLPDLRHRPGLGVAKLAALAVVTVSAMVWAPGWNREIITSGPYFYGDEVLEVVRDTRDTRQIERVIEAAFDLVDYREGATTVASVRRQGNTLLLQAGGYIEAASYAPTQQLIAHLPLLLHGEAKDVLVIGLGTGITLSSVLKHPVESADCVEISAEVRDMARKYFADATGHAQDDPRAEVIIGDGRNHLRHCGKTYDVIVSQPSVPWMSGAASLFTYECFADMRKRLAPGGIACVWYQPWDTAMRDMRSLLRTWSRVFPHCYLFESPSLGEYMLIGMGDARSIPPDGGPKPAASADRHGVQGSLSAATVTRGITIQRIRDDLRRLSIVDASDLLGGLCLGPDAVRSYAGGAVINTDDNAYIEFTTPAGIFTRERLKQHEALHRVREPATRHVDTRMLTDEQTAQLTKRLEAIFRSKELVLAARKLDGEQEHHARWRELMIRAAELNPHDTYVIQRRQAWQQQ